MKENEQERPVERTEPASQTGKKSGADSPQERLRRNIQSRFPIMSLSHVYAQ